MCHADADDAATFCYPQPPSSLDRSKINLCIAKYTSNLRLGAAAADGEVKFTLIHICRPPVLALNFN